MEGISMNINFNKLLQNLMPFLYVIFMAYILSVLVFFFLPKNGVEFVLDKSSNLEYRKYSFYSNTKKTEDKTLKENKTIQTLDKYQLKAIYYVNSNKGWITVQEKAGNKSHILSHGEEIDGYVLNELFFDYVIFIKNEKEYKLEITKSSITNFEINKPSKELTQKDNGAVVNRNYLNSYITNIDKIWDNIAIIEVKNGNNIDGFKIEKIKKDSVFSKLGLKEGDIIKTVNNNSLNSYAEAFKVYNDIGNVRHLNMEVLRNNEIVELNYEID